MLTLSSFLYYLQVLWFGMRFLLRLVVELELWQWICWFRDWLRRGWIPFWCIGPRSFQIRIVVGRGLLDFGVFFSMRCILRFWGYWLPFLRSRRSFLWVFGLIFRYRPFRRCQGRFLVVSFGTTFWLIWGTGWRALYGKGRPFNGLDAMSRLLPGVQFWVDVFRVTKRGALE